MTNSKLSQVALQKIWSALHFSNETNHSEQKILALIKLNHNNSYLQELINNLEQNRQWSSSVLTEFENIFIENPNLKTQIVDIIKNSKGDSEQKLPKEAELEIPDSYKVGTDYSPGGWELLRGIIKVFSGF